MKRFSLLELLHPDGKASTSFVLGSNCPESLVPERPIESDQDVALFVLAPSVKECQSKGWLEEAAKLVQQRLSEDGVCYVLVPPPWRLKSIRLLSRAKLVIDSSFWHFPDCASSRYLVPLQRGPAEFAVKTIVSAPHWKRALAREMFRFAGGRRILSMFWNSAGISVRRPGARPLFQWLFQPGNKAFFSGTAIVRRTWRGSQGANILYCFTEQDTLPSAIAKTTSTVNSSLCLEKESQVLEALGPGVRSAGVKIPEILRQEHGSQYFFLVLSPIRGRPASDLLASHLDSLSPILIKIVDWLERWHISTAHIRRLDREQIQQDVFMPLQQLTSFLPNAEEYRDWLAARVQAIAGISLPFVATHNDLTMANVLVAEHNHLGVVDWETGMAESWPLVDFYYAVTDAVRIAKGQTQWLEALKDWHQPDGRYTKDVYCWEERLRSAIGISPDWAELCFHACWLHHAANEQQVSQPGDPRPFLQIVQWLALNYSRSHANRT